MLRTNWPNGSGGCGAVSSAWKRRAMAELSHPIIVAIRDIVRQLFSQQFLVMEYVDGLDLEENISKTMRHF